MPAEELEKWRNDRKNWELSEGTEWDCAAREEGTFSWFVNNHWDPEWADAEVEYNRWIKSKEKPPPKEHRYVFITIQDKQRRLCDVDKLQAFIKRISYMYLDGGQWVIETGKKTDPADFNVHIHLLVKINKKIKNHKKTLNIKWKQFFDTDLYDKDYYLMKQCRDSKDMVPYWEWLEEKELYFINDMKGEHKNTVDLGLAGEFTS